MDTISPFFQNSPGIRHSMNDLIVHRGAQHKLKRFTGGRHVVALESGLRSGIVDHLTGGHFEVHGAGAFDGNLFHLLQHLPNQQAASPHLLQFRGGFTHDHRFSIAWPIFQTPSRADRHWRPRREPASRPSANNPAPDGFAGHTHPTAGGSLPRRRRPPHQFLTVQIAQLIHFRWAERDVVRGSAARALAASGQRAIIIL